MAQKNSTLWCVALHCAAVLFVFNSTVMAADAPRIGVEEHLGQMLPLENLTFVDEQGKSIDLKTLLDKPVVLTLVYYRCPGICTPLLNELVRNVDMCDLTPGKDYRLVTISFDPTEGAELARLKKETMLGAMKQRKLEPDAWRFLTGDEDNIQRISDAVGFYYMKDENGVDYIHAATIMFLSPEGKVVRYLHGSEFNPADLKLAIVDASEGRARSFMQRLQKLCYTYDPDSRGYVLQTNRIILGITVVFVVVFGGFLLFLGRRRRASIQGTEGAAP